MDILFLSMLLAIGWWGTKRYEDQQRIRLLSGLLGKFRIEHRMQQLTDGYLRALDESDPERSAPIWRNLEGTEQALLAELLQLTETLQQVWSERLRVSRWSWGVPLATRLFPQQCFDFRMLVQLHTQGLEQAIRNSDTLSTRDRAFRITAELLLFQHSCHWFCRSKLVASARLQVRHRTSYSQVLAAIGPATQAGYPKLTATS